MDGSTTKRTDQDFMKRLIAGLLSLGLMAERVIDRSFPVRVVILWILSRSECLAWRHIPDDVMSPFIVHHRYSRIHAQHFAWLFKTAAYWLKRKLREKQRFARKWDKWITRRVNEAIGGDTQELSRLYPPPTWGGSRRRRGVGGLVGWLHDLFIAPLPRLDSS